MVGAGIDYEREYELLVEDVKDRQECIALLRAENERMRTAIQRFTGYTRRFKDGCWCVSQDDMNALTRALNGASPSEGSDS